MDFIEQPLFGKRRRSFMLFVTLSLLSALNVWRNGHTARKPQTDKQEGEKCLWLLNINVDDSFGQIVSTVTDIRITFPTSFQTVTWVIQLAAWKFHQYWFINSVLCFIIRRQPDLKNKKQLKLKHYYVSSPKTAFALNDILKCYLISVAHEERVSYCPKCIKKQTNISFNRFTWCCERNKDKKKKSIYSQYKC